MGRGAPALKEVLRTARYIGTGEGRERLGGQKGNIITCYTEVFKKDGGESNLQKDRPYLTSSRCLNAKSSRKQQGRKGEKPREGGTNFHKGEKGEEKS